MENNMTEKKIHIPSLVLMIIGALFALILPIVTYQAVSSAL